MFVAMLTLKPPNLITSEVFCLQKLQLLLNLLYNLIRVVKDTEEEAQANKSSDDDSNAKTGCKPSEHLHVVGKMGIRFNKQPCQPERQENHAVY